MYAPSSGITGGCSTATVDIATSAADMSGTGGAAIPAAGRRALSSASLGRCAAVACFGLPAKTGGCTGGSLDMSSVR